MPSRIGIISHRRKHKSQEKKRRKKLAGQPPAPSMPTLDEFLNSAPGSAPFTIPSASSNDVIAQTSVNAAADALFDDLDFEATQETGDPEAVYFPNSRIPNPDAPSPSLKFENEFMEIFKNYSNKKWSLFEEKLADFVDFSQARVGIKNSFLCSQKPQI